MMLLKKIHHLINNSEDADLFKKAFRVGIFSNDKDDKKILTEEEIYTFLNTFLLILESELRKAMLFLDSSDEEYPDRLRDMISLVEFMYVVSKEMSMKDNLEQVVASLSFKVV